MFQVHRVLSFKQTPWLKEYIYFNTSQRSRATKSFHKNFYKLMNNAVFCKTMENLRNRRKIDLVSTKCKLNKLVAQSSFQSFKIFHTELVAVERRKVRLFLNRPIYVGFTVLDLSKHLMYKFHYEHIKVLYPGKLSTLLFTDTDSLTYAIQTEDIYEDMKQHQDRYDFSEYQKEHKCYSTRNRKVVGKFKDELKG